MLRVLFITLFLAVPIGAPGQTLSVLHITVVLTDAGQHATPVPRHALLISDNPPTATPRRVVTGPDGAVDVRLRPGTYTVESDRPVAFESKAYEWTQRVEITAGRDVTLAMTNANADIEPVSADSMPLSSGMDTDPSLRAAQWRDSVLAVWTPTSRASGFVVADTGLMATNQRSVGTATSVEVQLSPTLKVLGRVIVSDAAHDVAIIWANPQVLAAIRPIPLGCTATASTPVVDGSDIFTLGVPVHEQTSVTSGSVSRAEPRPIVTDFILPDGSAGGPVFAVDGHMVGLTSTLEIDDGRRRGHISLARLDDVCTALASAETKTRDASPPGAAPLPVEPRQPYPVASLQEVIPRRIGNLSPYTSSSSDFDIAFMTPVHIYAAQSQGDRTGGRDTGGSRTPRTLVNPVADFSNWSSYVADVPPVLFIRATPKLVESFWTTVARGAALTQGVALPSMKHAKFGFSRMRVLCGTVEVPPIHPFVLEQHVSETDLVTEGLYVFDPGALGPHCGTVSLVLYSEKEPDKGDTRVVDLKVIQQVWQDFEAYRALK